jgi:hypothetical protein
MTSVASASVSALSAAIAAAQPIDKAGTNTLNALQLQAAACVALIDADIAANAVQLDSIDLSAMMPDAAATALSTLVGWANEQSAMVHARGLIGRVTSNIDQLVP